jgi:serine/threonine-protein kinase
MKRYFILSMITMIACNKEKPKVIQPVTEKKWVVTTIAGEGSPAFANGPALSAKFHFPEDVVMTTSGLYATDVLNFSIRKIAGGQVTTFAGGTISDIINGNGTTAKFKNPYSIAVDANGNLYTTDENDPRIRKITPAGEVTTYAGKAISGFADGDADTSRFFPGNSITIDGLGNLYMADAFNNRIRKISTDGKVTTIAGSGDIGFKNGIAVEARFALPGGIARDKDGNLYIADRGNFCIRKITRAGEVSTFSGSGVPGNKDGAPGEAQFTLDMRDIVIDALGNLYLSESNRIRKITPQGVVSTIAGSNAGFADGEALSAKFNFPNGMGINAQGAIYVADLNNNRIRKLSFE